MRKSHRTATTPNRMEAPLGIMLGLDLVQLALHLGQR